MAPFKRHTGHFIGNIDKTFLDQVDSIRDDLEGIELGELADHGHLTAEVSAFEKATSVTDHGALGDGEADDHEAFEAALAAADLVYVPQPDVQYSVSDTVVVPDGKALIGIGGNFRNIAIRSTDKTRPCVRLEGRCGFGNLSLGYTQTLTREDTGAVALALSSLRRTRILPVHVFNAGYGVQLLQSEGALETGTNTTFDVTWEHLDLTKCYIRHLDIRAWNSANTTSTFDFIRCVNFDQGTGRLPIPMSIEMSACVNVLIRSLQTEHTIYNNAVLRAIGAGDQDLRIESWHMEGVSFDGPSNPPALVVGRDMTVTIGSWKLWNNSTNPTTTEDGTVAYLFRLNEDSVLRVGSFISRGVTKNGASDLRLWSYGSADSSNARARFEVASLPGINTNNNDDLSGQMAGLFKTGEPSGGEGGGSWGSITGSLRDQTDLATTLDGKADADALDAKADASHGHTLSEVSDAGALAAKDTVATADIDNDAVTLAKLGHLGVRKVFGTDGTGAPVELSQGAGIILSGSTVAVDIQHSLQIATGKIQLRNDLASPGNNKVYGTDGAGVRGWKDDPAGGGAAEFTVGSALPTSGTVTIDLSTPGRKTHPKLTATGVVNFEIAGSPAENSEVVVPFRGDGNAPTFAAGIKAWGANGVDVATYLSQGEYSSDFSGANRYFIFRHEHGITTMLPWPLAGPELASRAISTGKIADGAVTPAKLDRAYSEPGHTHTLAAITDAGALAALDTVGSADLIRGRRVLTGTGPHSITSADNEIIIDLIPSGDAQVLNLDALSSFPGGVHIEFFMDFISSGSVQIVAAGSELISAGNLGLPGFGGSNNTRNSWFLGRVNSGSLEGQRWVLNRGSGGRWNLEGPVRETLDGDGRIRLGTDVSGVGALATKTTVATADLADDAVTPAKLDRAYSEVGHGHDGQPIDMQGELLTAPQLRDFSQTMPSVTPSEGVLTLDLEQSNTFNVTLTEDITSISIVNPPPSGQLGTATIRFEQDATGGRTIDFSGLDFGDKGAPAMPESGRLWISTMTLNAGSLWEAVCGYVASVAILIGQAWADGTFWTDGTGWI